MNMAPSQDSPENKPKNPEAIQRETGNALNRKSRIAEFGVLRKLMNKPKIPVSSHKIIEEDIPTEASPELIAEAERRRYEAHNEAGKYYGPSEEELTRRNLLIKSMQIDKGVIAGKKIFIQELIKKDDPKFREEIKRRKAEVEELEEKLQEKRKDVEKSITTVIDEIEANTPGLSETLLKEQIKLKVAVEAEREGDRQKDLAMKDEEAKNLAIFQALLLKNKYAEDRLSEPEQLI